MVDYKLSYFELRAFCSTKDTVRMLDDVNQEWFNFLTNIYINDFQDVYSHDKALVIQHYTTPSYKNIQGISCLI